MIRWLIVGWRAPAACRDLGDCTCHAGERTTSTVRELLPLERAGALVGLGFEGLPQLRDAAREHRELAPRQREDVHRLGAPYGRVALRAAEQRHLAEVVAARQRRDALALAHDPRRPPAAHAPAA